MSQTSSGLTICIGFYRAYQDNGNPTNWNEMGLFNPGEEYICDACMRGDSRFKDRYPWLSVMWTPK